MIGFFLTPTNFATLWHQPSVLQFRTNYPELLSDARGLRTQSHKITSLQAPVVNIKSSAYHTFVQLGYKVSDPHTSPTQVH